MTPDLIRLLTPIGAGTLVTLAVVLIYTGRWIPARTLKNYVPLSIYKEMQTDRDLWRTLALEERTQKERLLLPTAMAARQTFAAVDQVIHDGNGGGGSTGGES